MHEQHVGSETAGEHERLTEELRSLLRALAARAEELLLAISAEQRDTDGEHGVDTASGSAGCPLCAVTAVLRDAGARRRVSGLSEPLVSLLASLREAFTATAGEPTADGEQRSAGAEGSTGDPTGEAGEQRTREQPREERPEGEPRVRSIAVRRVRGNVLTGDSAG